MEFKLPDLGEGVHEGQILAVHVKEGQSINEDEILLEVETDKAAVEIPSPCTGIVTTVHIKDKQLVHVGDVMVTFNTDATTASPDTTSPTPLPGSSVRSSPSTRKFARKLGIDIATITGSGPGGRITKQDVERTHSTPVESVVVDTREIAKTRPPTQSTLKLETEIEGVQEQTEFGLVIRQPMSQAESRFQKQCVMHGRLFRMSLTATMQTLLTSMHCVKTSMIQISQI